MHIQRDTKRTLTVTAEEIYDALAAKYDLPALGDNSTVGLEDDGNFPDRIVVVAEDRSEQEA